MKFILSDKQWKALECDSADTNDFVRRCMYLGYGLLTIQGWLSGQGTIEFLEKVKDVRELSDLMGITNLDSIEKDSK